MYGETKEKLQEAAKVAGVPVIEVVNTLEEATKKAYELVKKKILFYYHQLVQVGINLRILKFVGMNLLEL